MSGDDVGDEGAFEALDEILQLQLALLQAGDLQLVDVETGVGQDVTVDQPMFDLYVRRLLAWREEIGSYCTRRGIYYATIETSTPWEELILFELRRMGVVR